MEAIKEKPNVNAKLGLKEKIAYGTGDLGNGLMFQMAQMYLLKFYTDVLGISPYWGGMIFLVTKFVDAVTDAGVGTYVDSRTNIGPKGKFRPFILYGALFLGLATIAAFLAPNLGPVAKIVYAFVSYNIMSLAYTVVNIPYGSMSSSMTTDSIERTQLSVYRNIGAQVAIFITGVVVIPLINRFNSPAVGYPVVVGMMAVIGVLSLFFCYANVKERYVSKKPRVKGDGLKAFKGLFNNKPLVVLCIFTILSITAMFLKLGLQLYYFEYVLGNEGLISTVSVLNLVALIPSFMIASKVVAKLGKKNTAIMGTVGFLIAELLNFFIFGQNTVPFLIVNIFSQFFLSFPNTVAWALVADTVDFGEWKTGLRSEGITYSSYSFIRKLGQGFAGFIPGAALAAIGYQANVAQSASTITGIRMVYFIFPAVASVIAALVLWFGYDLTDKRHKEISDELRERNAEE